MMAIVGSIWLQIYGVITVSTGVSIEKRWEHGGGKHTRHVLALDEFDRQYTHERREAAPGIDL